MKPAIATWHLKGSARLTLPGVKAWIVPPSQLAKDLGKAQLRRISQGCPRLREAESWKGWNVPSQRQWGVETTPGLHPNNLNSDGFCSTRSSDERLLLHVSSLITPRLPDQHARADAFIGEESAGNRDDHYAILHVDHDIDFVWKKYDG
jgi:hypothetical protein